MVDLPVAVPGRAVVGLPVAPPGRAVVGLPVAPPGCGCSRALVLAASVAAGEDLGLWCHGVADAGARGLRGPRSLSEKGSCEA